MEQIITKSAHVGFYESRQGGRPDNQDSCWGGDTKLGLLLVVCDGMGGGPSGKFASSTAVKSIVEYVNDASLSRDKKLVLKDAIEHANTTLRNNIQKQPELAGMGTTVVAMLIDDYSALIAHVGDSRCYQLRDRKKTFRTQDHSKVAEMVRSGTITEEQARLSDFSNLITRALGTNDSCEADIDERAYEKGDRFILCSDGTWSSMPENELVQLLTKVPSESGTVESVAIHVDEIGQAEGGHYDNHTLMILKTRNNSQLIEPMNRKTKLLLQALTAILAISLFANVIQYCNRVKAFKPQKEQTPSFTVNVDSILKVNKAQYDKKIDSLQLENIKLQDQINDNRFLPPLKPAPKEKANQDEQNKPEETKKTEPKQQANVDQGLIDFLESVISDLQTLKNQPSKKAKEDGIKSLRTKLSQKEIRNKLEKYGLDKNLKNVYDRLNDNIAHKNDDKSKDHYDILINKVNEMKKIVKQGKK